MAKKNVPDIRLFDSSEELSSGLADYINEISESCINEKGSFSLVLSGGDLPKRLEKLTNSPYLKTVEWRKWYVFWAEENVVPKRHPDSIYWQTKEYFLSKVPILPDHILPVSHGVPGESAANCYESSIRQLVKNRTVPALPLSDCPRFDLILLNLGVNGYVASYVVPEDEEESKWVSCVSIDGYKERVTTTLPVINAAAHVAIVASGNEVAPSFLDAMMGQKPKGNNPVQMVWPKDGKLVWLVDKIAASLFLKGTGCASTSSDY
ncbi:probable 6-phosphogluconolactonase 1 [Jatropha curcas]|uniref:probable 6-phosphogluconolactonase 1 n=1 Tax=Jatropha curcas TaxID=180498 RepID=UPI0005FB4579|nr:probable 6-phosphogluconolactonase 1 [Jatropha curcas]